MTEQILHLHSIIITFDKIFECTLLLVANNNHLFQLVVKLLRMQFLDYRICSANQFIAG